MALAVRALVTSGESSCLRVQLKKGGITDPRLNNDGKPIANKYRKGKMERTLKRECKELEAVEMDAVGHMSRKRARERMQGSRRTGPCHAEQGSLDVLGCVFSTKGVVPAARAMQQSLSRRGSS